MKYLTSVKAMLVASLLGLTLASSVAYGADFDAGTRDASVGVLTASETPTDIAPTDSTPAAEAADTAPEEVETAPGITAMIWPLAVIVAVSRATKKPMVILITWPSGKSKVLIKTRQQGK